MKNKDIELIKEYKKEFDKLNPYDDNSEFIKEFELLLFDLKDKYNLKIKDNTNNEYLINKLELVNYDKFIKAYYSFRSFPTVTNKLISLIDFLIELINYS